MDKRERAETLQAVRNDYRTEWKYRCGEEELAAIAGRLDGLLSRDEHAAENGGYTIHSLYFDDYRDTCARENEAKLQWRYKYRLRFYDRDTGFIKLERKEKYGGRCHKESCVISLEQCRGLIAGDMARVLWGAEQKLLRRFCVEALNRYYSPVLIVDYERTIFVEPAANIRITLDRNISVSDKTDAFLTGGYLGYPVQKAGEHILEVKFDSILPGYIKNTVSSAHLSKINFSKYYYGRLKLQEMGGIKWARP